MKLRTKITREKIPTVISTHLLQNSIHHSQYPEKNSVALKRMKNKTAEHLFKLKPFHAH